MEVTIRRERMHPHAMLEVGSKRGMTEKHLV